jgi:hypothetical protein
MSFKLIIAGGRDFANRELVRLSLKDYLKENNLKVSDLTIVSGHGEKWDAKSKTYELSGADKLGEDIAIKNNIPLLTFPADWSKYGRAAGPKRNEEMAKVANGLLAFWDGESRGTLSMINNAKKRGLIVKVIQY